MRLQLDRPLLFFDLETTGINLLQDRIVELSTVKIFPDGHREVKTRRLNPGMHIPEESSAVHGIYDRDVAEEPAFNEIAPCLSAYFSDCDLGGYNICKFDIPMLTNEFKRAGITFSTEG
ncbi:MAG: 3'-5' exonuclease, partial [Victivallales bacterium]|nr:3'-5' exonuclease [Victivallales bacterium]